MERLLTHVLVQGCRVAYWDCNASIDQWSPAFSVASILVQLHAFLLSPDLLYDTAKVGELPPVLGAT